MNLDDWLPPFKMDRGKKQPQLIAELNELNQYHWQNCSPYRRVIAGMFGNLKNAITSLEEMPWLPASLFKTVEMSSVPSNEVAKVMASSGTTGMQTSKIMLDAATASNQTRVLVSIVKEFLPERRPMLIIDNDAFLKDRSKFNARAAAILGFSNFGAHRTYLLDEDLMPQWDVLKAFIERHRDQPVFIFGFTWLVWDRLVREAKKAGISIEFPPFSVLIHGGGWKKLQQMAVSNEEFKYVLNEQFGIRHSYNYYGMIEQVGSIYMECSEGVFHAPSYADIIIRSPETLEALPFHSTGLIQTFSILPRSYPGHSLLTEDLGTILGEDDCACGRKGKYFHVHGRMPHAELRGCSDVIALGG
jgi:phenylacetate-coenzyme A ligase PaaK-like adenylate-forming protein